MAPRSNLSDVHHPVLVVDAFSAKPFHGNPAAVCLLEEPASEDWMQRVAAEMNLSETAFVAPASGGWHLRWFTPVAEVALCGHATLASAHVLWETGLLATSGEARFETRVSGCLTCRREEDWIAMDFPSRSATPVAAPAGLAEALGCPLAWVGRTADDYLVEVGSAETVRELAPNIAALAALPVRGVIVTARADHAPYDFLSRFFAPAVGVAEDPVTGSAHCALAPYWSGRLGRENLRGWQASRRGGEVRTRIQGDRVELRGQAVTVWEGMLRR